MERDSSIGWGISVGRILLITKVQLITTCFMIKGQPEQNQAVNSCNQAERQERALLSEGYAKVCILVGP